jgi:hypothetical protein
MWTPDMDAMGILRVGHLNLPNVAAPQSLPSPDEEKKVRREKIKKLMRRREK